MIEELMKKNKSKEEYDNDIKETNNNLVTINESIEFWSKKKPFKKKNKEYEERVEKLCNVKRYLEERLDRLNEEKRNYIHSFFSFIITHNFTPYLPLVFKKMY